MLFRRLMPSDTDQYGRRVQFEQVPHEAVRTLPAHALGLLVYLLYTGGAIKGPISELYRVAELGLSKDELREAQRALTVRGYLGFIDERDSRGRLCRVPTVSAIPGYFSPQPGVPAVSRGSHRMTSGYAESPQAAPSADRPRPVRPAETSIRAGGTERGQAASGVTWGDGTSAQVGPSADRPRPVRPATTMDSAGGTERGGAAPRTTWGDGTSAQVGPSADRPRPVRPAEMIDWSDIDAAHGHDPSRARARQTPTTTDTHLPPPVGTDPPQGHPGRGEEEIQLRFQRMAYDVAFRLPRQLQMNDQQRAEVLPDIAARLAEGHTTGAVLEAITARLPEVIPFRPGFIRSRLSGMPPWRLPESRTDGASVADRGIYAAGARPGRVDAAEGRRKLRDALRQSGEVRDEA